MTALALAACAAPPPLEPDTDPAESAYQLANLTPTWGQMPLSWEKLDTIEDWLDRNRYSARKSLVARADLELAEGRLSFAKTQPGTTPQALGRRVASSEEGFRRVLGNPGADAELLRRAHQGLREAKDFHPRSQHVASDDPTLVRRTGWNARSASPARLTRHTGRWNSLTVHHSARTNADQLGGGSNAEVADALRRVQHVHMQDRGFGDIGYHFLIDPRGRVYEGRSMRWQGAHANGANNVGNIGVCLLGNFDVESPRGPALEALERLVDDLTRRHGIPKSRVYAHQDLRPTECPGDRLLSWVHRYRGSYTAATHHGTRSRSSVGRIR